MDGDHGTDEETRGGICRLGIVRTQWTEIKKDASSIDNHHSTALDKRSICTSLFTNDTQNSIDLLRIEVETGPYTTDDQHSTDSEKKETEHSTVDLIRTEGERESSPRVNQGPPQMGVY